MPSWHAGVGDFPQDIRGVASTDRGRLLAVDDLKLKTLEVLGPGIDRQASAPVELTSAKQPDSVRAST